MWRNFDLFWGGYLSFGTGVSMPEGEQTPLSLSNRKLTDYFSASSLNAVITHTEVETLHQHHREFGTLGLFGAESLSLLRDGTVPGVVAQTNTSRTRVYTHQHTHTNDGGKSRTNARQVSHQPAREDGGGLVFPKCYFWMHSGKVHFCSCARRNRASSSWLVVFPDDTRRMALLVGRVFSDAPLERYHTSGGEVSSVVRCGMVILSRKPKPRRFD